MRKIQLLLVLPIILSFFVFLSFFTKSVYACTYTGSAICTSSTTYGTCDWSGNYYTGTGSCTGGQVCFTGGTCQYNCVSDGKGYCPYSACNINTPPTTSRPTNYWCQNSDGSSAATYQKCCNIPSCTGYYGCVGTLAYTSSWGGSSCVRTGTRAPSADYLCGGGGSGPTPTPVPSACSVTWSNFPSSPLTPGTTYSNISINKISASPTWNQISVYMDGSRARETGLANGSPYQFSFIAPSPGSHTLTFYNLDASGYSSGGTNGPDANAVSCGSQSFTTGNPAVNGACSATHYNCSAGTSSGGRPSSIINPPAWEWNCLGSNGGSDTYCTDPFPSCNTGAVSCGATCNADGTQTCTHDTLPDGTRTCAPTTYTHPCPPPSAPTLTSETPYCSGLNSSVKDLRWTDGANTTSSTAYYCDKTVGDQYGGCVPDNGSIDSHRWYRLLTDPFTLIPGHDYLWLIADANASGHTNSATRQFTAPTCTFNASGLVYEDKGKNRQFDVGIDSPYPGGATITICQGNQPGGCSSPYETLTSASNGTFTTTSKPLAFGTYTAILTVPSGYQAIFPKPPIAVFTGEADVTGINFGISNSFPWMQAIGGDITGNYISDPNQGGFANNIPNAASVAAGACSANGAYSMANGLGGTHGLINTGFKDATFGQGQLAAAQAWLVGGNAGNTYAYNMPLSKQTKTAYGNLSYLVKQSNVSTTDLATLANCGIPSTSCSLSPDNSIFPSKVYTVNGDLTLNGSGSPASYTFPIGQYVILVNGKININTKIVVPNGSFVLFSASDDINVAATVGDTYNIATSNLEGYYSTDKSFNILGKNISGNGANCATTNNEDLRLNVAGSIVINASTINGGSFNYSQRDMCAYDKQCPVFTISERPDFILNSPTFLMFPRRVWQEVAP